MRVVEHYVAGRAMIGQSACGDDALVTDFDGGTMVAAIDGLGHGDEAAFAASLAKKTLGENAGEPLEALIRRCHETLKKTRGVVATLARFEASTDTLVWAGVGNVEGVLCRRNPEGGYIRESVLLTGGIIGYMLPNFRVTSVPIRPGDTLVLATDGISSGFGDSFSRDADLAEIAEGLLADYGKPSDDALVLVARYIGGKPA